MRDNSKDYHVANIVGNEAIQCEGYMDFVCRNMEKQIAKGILAIISDGKEYVIRMLPEERIERREIYSVEVRQGISVKEIVHCKDCIHNRGTQPGMVFCPQIVGSWVEEDFFCADGERRKE